MRFALVLAGLVSLFFHESLFGGKVLSSADVLFVQASFRDIKGPDYEPYNRLLMDPVLQFQPWIEFNRQELHAGRLPLWNPSSGCGTPHLANGQSAVFDPVQLIAYLGPLPQAYAWMAAVRLWIAGVGMYLLASHWGAKRAGRFFAGLVYPFTGFLVVWLLYPVTNVAVWLPWILWASDRLLDRPSIRRFGAMALVVGLCLVGGHVQTSAHVLLASGLSFLWRVRRIRFLAAVCWTGATLLGIGIAAIEILPLADYLTKSPVWTDRAAERKPVWELAKPRMLDMACTGLPYAFGSQTRGHPNLARALNVHNLNESAGGFAGLATLVLLAPLGVMRGWKHSSHVRWLTLLTVFALLAAYRWFPADNFLRALPVLNVTDNRRLSLWIAFGLTLLGAFGLDRLGSLRRIRHMKIVAPLLFVAAIPCAIAALAIPLFEAKIHAKAVEHYAQMAKETPGADPAIYRARADRQTRDTIRFVQRYYGIASVHFVGIATAIVLIRKRTRGIHSAVFQPAFIALVLVDVIGFGMGLNPAIPPEDDRPVPAVIAFLRQVAPPPNRVLGVGEELPPNVCMRYGLWDIRNYDSVEMTNSLDFFSALYPQVKGERTSRRAVTWEGVLRARKPLEIAGVRAIVAATPPPEGAFARVEKIGDVWVALPDAAPLAVSRNDRGETLPIEAIQKHPDKIDLEFQANDKIRDMSEVQVHVTRDDGWRGSEKSSGSSDAFLRLKHASGDITRELVYRPPIVYFAGFLSFFSLIITVFTLTRFGLLPSTRYMLLRLGRTQAFGLESDSFNPLPDNPTGENSRKRR